MSFRQSVILIIVCILITYGNCLFNDFTGDTKGLYHNNNFYKDPKNLSLLFSRQLVMAPQEVQGGFTLTPSSFSGCVSYRPVVALSFFFDYTLFKENPSLHHLTNIVLHILTAVLVYIFLVPLLPKNNLALLAALLFSLHPVQAEAVANIGYRSDLLMTLFYVLSLLFFHSSVKDKRGIKKGALILSYVFFLLSLFSKESAVTLPVMLFLYDSMFLREERESIPQFVKRRALVYAGVLAILVFYLYVYLISMPNAFYPKFVRFEGSFFNQVAVAATIFLQYLKAFLFPFAVKILPPLYYPVIPEPRDMVVLASVLIVLLLFATSIAIYHRRREISFGILWFLVTYLPVSNAVSLLNPMAYRFMYLPFIGVSGLLVLLIDQIIVLTQSRYPAIARGRLLWLLPLGICVALTLSLNAFFKNSLVAAKEMIRVFPDSSRPYWSLGIEYFEQGRRLQAAYYFEKYLGQKVRNPYVLSPSEDFSVYHFLGKCYKETPQKAIPYFQKSVELNPDNFLGYIDLAEMYTQTGEYEKAIQYAQRAVAINADFSLGYVFVIHSLFKLERTGEAKEKYQAFMTRFPSDRNTVRLKKLFHP